MFFQNNNADSVGRDGQMRRYRIELEVIGKKKLRPIWLMDIEHEVLKSRAKLLGWSISEYVGMILSEHACKVNEVVADVLSEIGGMQ